jgi:phosphatidylglycerophosphatase A
MKIKAIQITLGIYDLIMAAGAIYCGSLMIQSNSGEFAEFPKEWLSKLPFDNWVTPGIFVIILFGIGNILAAVSSYRKNGRGSWIPSEIMGVLLFISLVFSTIILEAWYLATTEFLIFSIIQIFLSTYLLLLKRKNKPVN